LENLTNREKAEALSIVKVASTLPICSDTWWWLQFEASLEDMLEKVRSGSRSPPNNDLIAVFLRWQNSARWNELVASLSSTVSSRVDELVVSHKSQYEQIFRDLVSQSRSIQHLAIDLFKK
jgi:hypothetical protein